MHDFFFLFFVEIIMAIVQKPLITIKIIKKFSDPPLSENFVRKQIVYILFFVNKPETKLNNLTKIDAE